MRRFLAETNTNPAWVVIDARPHPSRRTAKLRLLPDSRRQQRMGGRTPEQILAHVANKARTAFNAEPDSSNGTRTT
jgi:hypothetical protein